MLSAVVLGALLVAGCGAQLVPVQSGAVCRGTAIQVDYQYCGSLAMLNIFWTYRPGATPAESQLNMLVEGRDGNWASAGFGINVGANQMAEARAAFACQSIQGNGDVVLDNFLAMKSVAGVTSGLGMGNQSLMNPAVGRRNGVCGFRTERLAMPPSLAAVNEPLLNIVNGTANVFIAATGTPDNMLAIHNVARAAAMVDFVQGTAQGMGMLLDLNPTMAPTDNSAAALQLSSALVAAAASLLASLW